MISIIDLVKTKDVEKTLKHSQKNNSFLSHHLGFIDASSYNINNDKELDTLYDDVTLAPYRLINVSQWKKFENYEQAVSQKEFTQLNQKNDNVIDTGIYNVLISSGDTQNMTTGNLVIVTLFKVKTAENDSFIETWTRSKDYMQKRIGFISACLQKSISPNNPYSFLNVSQWMSKQEFVAAVKTPNFAELHKKITHYESHPHFCECISFNRETAKEPS